MLSAFLITRVRVGYAVAAFRSKRRLFGPEFTGSLRAAAQSHAGWLPLRGWLRWRYG